MAKKNKIIVQAGYDKNQPTTRFREVPDSPNILLDSPELFYFNINKWIHSVQQSTQIDMSNRARLYDLYKSCMLDSHLSAVIRKRKIAVSRIPIEFRRDGQADEVIGEQIRSPWFRRFVKSTIDIPLYGFACYQFFKDQTDERYIDFTYINPKHVNPIAKQILRYQHDTNGIPFDNFENVMLACDDPRNIGILAQVVPWVLYKRNNVADWSEFCQIFGIPIREYTYDSGDEEARQQLIKDARNQGSCAVYIHPSQSTLNLIEPSNASGTVDVFEKFCRFCNEQISVAILGNTLTTGTGSSGSEALGKVHQDEEDELKADDRDAVLSLLNYNLTDIFKNLGFNVDGGEFVYAKEKNTNPNAQVDIVMKLYSMGLPISDDYLYNTFNIEKPEDYEEQKKKVEEEAEVNKQMKQAQIEATQTPQRDVETDPTNHKSRFYLFNRFMDFFVQRSSKEDHTLEW